MVLNALVSQAFLAVARQRDNHVGTLDTPEKQDALLTDLLSTQDLQYTPANSKTPVNHTLESLKQTINNTARRNIRGTKDSKYRTFRDRFFQEGTECIKESYLEAIGYHAPAATSAHQAHPSGTVTADENLDAEIDAYTLSRSSGKDSDAAPPRRKRKASESNVAEYDGTKPPTKAPKTATYKAQESDTDLEIVSPVSSSPKVRRRLQRGLRRNFEDAFDDSDEVESPRRKQQKIHREAVAGGTSSASSATSTNDTLHHGVKRDFQGTSAGLAGAKASTTEQELGSTISRVRTNLKAAETTESAFTSGSKDLPQQQTAVSQATAKNLEHDQESTDAMYQQDAYKTSRPIHPPFVIQYCLPFTLQLKEFDQMVRTLQMTMDTVIKAFLEDMNIDTMSPTNTVNLVSHPSPSLQGLYQRVFGFHWAEHAADLQAVNVIQGSELLKSLISFFLTDNVFTDRVPWQSPLGVLEDPALEGVKKYLGDLINERGGEFEKLVRESAMSQARDQEFQDTTIASEASTLTYQLLRILHEQTLCIRADRKPVDGWHDRFKKGVQNICKQALTLNAMMLASSDTFTWIWPPAKTGFDSKSMQASIGRVPEKGTSIHFTVFPGWRCEPAMKMYHTIVATKAMVNVDLSTAGSIHNTRNFT